MGCSLIFTHKIEHTIKTDLEGLLKNKFTTPYHFSSDDKKYLEGLRDAGFKEAQVLIDAIDKYGEITLELCC